VKGACSILRVYADERMCEKEKQVESDFFDND